MKSSEVPALLKQKVEGQAHTEAFLASDPSRISEDVDTLEHEDDEISTLTDIDDGESQNEALNSIRVDFDYERYDNPPIREVFSPEEELARIRSLPRGVERHHVLQEYKSKLERQRVAHTRCRLFLERLVENDNDVPLDNLREVVSLFAREYGFDETRINLYNKIINDYQKKRIDALRFHIQFTNEHALVEALTSQKIDTTIPLEVKRGPLSLDIFTNNEGTRRLYASAGGSVASGSVIRGFASLESKTGMYYSVINTENLEKVQNRASSASHEDVLEHEHVHHVNRLIRAHFENIEPNVLKERQLYFKENDPEVKSMLRDECMKAIFENVCSRAKDELLAQLYTSDIQEIKTGFGEMTKRPDGNSYDYFKFYREDKILSEDDEYQKGLLALQQTQFSHTLQRAMSALGILIHEMGYSKEEAVSTFTDKPLTEWLKIVERIKRYERATRESVV